MAGTGFKLEELPLVATILLDAALADGEVDGSEVETIRSLIAAATGAPRLSHEVGTALRGFDPATFDLDAACADLGLETRHRK